MTCPLKLAVSAAAMLALCAVVIAPGCSGCRGGGKAPLAYAPKDALLVVVIPSVEGSIRAAGKLFESLQGEVPLKAAIDAKKQQLVRELGFDPEKPETMKAKGIDPARGIVFTLGADGRSSALVLGVADQKALEKYLRETANKLLSGRATFKEQKVQGLSATLLTLSGEQDARLAWVYHDNHLLICPRSKDGKLAEYAASLALQKDSIKDNRTFTALRDKVDQHQLLVYVDGESAKRLVATEHAERLKSASEWLKQSLQRDKETLDALLGYLRGVAVGLQLSGKGAVARFYLALPEGKGKALREILAGAGDAPPFGEFIGPDALAVTRVTLHPKKLMNKLLELMPPPTKRQFYRQLDRVERETKINFEKDILSQLAGRYAMALFAPNAEALKQGFSLRRPAQMLTAVGALGMVQIKDTRKAADLLNTAERMMTSAGMDVRARMQGETRIFFIGSPATPAVSWTVHKGMAMVATGDRLDRTLKLTDKGGDNVLGEIESSRAKKVLNAEDGNIFYYNLAKTADSIRALNLPPEIKLMLSSLTSLLGRFNDLTWTIEPDDAGLVSELSLRLK